MKRSMHINSLVTYKETKIKHPSKSSQILNALEFLEGATMHSIAKYMGVPVHTISGRFGELRKANKIKEGLTTNNNKTIWKLVNT